MFQLQNLKHACMLSTQAVGTTATSAVTTFSLDTKGYDELQIVVIPQTHATSTITGFAIEHSDTDAASAFGAVTGYVAGTDYTVASIVGGTAATAATSPAVFNINLAGKKRYFRVSGIIGTTAITATVTSALGRAITSPITTAGQGATVVVNPS